MKKQTNQKQLFIWALKHAFLKFSPKCQIKNPVMFVVYLGSVISTLLCLDAALKGEPVLFETQITLWLWFTVFFANFSEALAEGKGKAQADFLKKSRSEVMANLVVNNTEIQTPGSSLKKDDIIICRTGEIIPADGEVIEGIASVDESAITGESAPVIRESGGDRSAVTGGTRVISDFITIRVTASQGQSFIDKMIALIESSTRQKTPNEIALNLLLCGLTLIFLAAVISLKFFADYAMLSSGGSINIINITVLTALLVCLIPTTISGLLSAIGIAGINRLFRLNVIASSGKAVEAAGDIDVLLLDKTGTITLGNRMAVEFISGEGFTPKDTASSAQLSSMSDETPEGRSIVTLAKNKFGLRAETLTPHKAKLIPFTAQTQMSGIDLQNEDGTTRAIRKGSLNAITKFIKENYGKNVPAQIIAEAEQISRKGGTPLVIADRANIAGVIYLKDIVKGGIKERFAELRKRGIKTVMITGDNTLTAAAIAAEAGVDDFMANATPEAKLERIRNEQAAGHLVAMTGDGTNDAPALAQADVGVSMNTGTQAAREAGNMVDLDSDPTKIIEIVETGKQMLITRGALTTFSIANDIAKYFAILPALFGGLYAANGAKGPLAVLDIMHLGSPQSAILSAVIFNALIIVVLIPLALRGVKQKAYNASDMLRRNVIIYGLGGLIAPFIGIKLIDILINLTGLI